MKVNKQKRSVLLRLDDEFHERFKARARDRGMPLTQWIQQACLAYEASANRFKQRKDEAATWPRCSLCGKHHDRQDHFAQ